MTWETVVKSPGFWVAVLAVVTLGWGMIYSTVKRIPIFGNQKAMFVGAVLGLLFVGGVANSLGLFSSTETASLSGSTAPSRVTDIQVTTSFAGNCTIAENSNYDDVIDVRCTDANVDEGTGQPEIATGLLTVTRTGSLAAWSCPVVATTARGWQSEKTPGDGSTYTILEVTTTNALEAYLANGAAATTSSPRERTSLAFAEGDADQTLGIQLEIEETAHDNLNQYSYKPVILSVCNKPFTFNIHRMD